MTSDDAIIYFDVVDLLRENNWKIKIHKRTIVYRYFKSSLMINHQHFLANSKSTNDPIDYQLFSILRMKYKYCLKKYYRSFVLKAE